MEARGGSSHPTEPKQGRLAERGVKRRFNEKETYDDGEKNDLRSGGSEIQTPPFRRAGTETSQRREGGGLPGGRGAGRAQRGQIEVYKRGSQGYRKRWLSAQECLLHEDEDLNSNL